MAITTNQFKNGLKFLDGGEPCTVLNAEFTKPGKGQAFTHVKYRNLKTGRVLEKNFKSGESVQIADVHERTMCYTYFDGNAYVFMDEKTFEQITVDAAVVGDCAKWLTVQDVCGLLLWNDMPISITVPNHVALQVTHTEPAVRGDTASGAVKSATLETGAEVKVPLFIDIDDIIKVDTRTGTYLGRTKT